MADGVDPNAQLDALSQRNIEFALAEGERRFAETVANATAEKNKQGGQTLENLAR